MFEDDESTGKRRFRCNFNVAALVLQISALLLLLTAAIVPIWLANPAGLSYYPYTRTWGLLVVHGRQTRTHTAIWQQMCKIAGQMTIGLTCTTVLCHWYAQKCSAYRIIMITSYTALIGLIIVVILTLVSMALSFKKVTTAQRAATVSTMHAQSTSSQACQFFAVFLTLASILIFYFGASQAFALINSAGYYPVPQPGMSLIMACVGTFVLGVAAILTAIRWRKMMVEKEYIEDRMMQKAQMEMDLDLEPTTYYS